MSDYGVDLYGNTILVSPKFAQREAGGREGFLRALMKGVQDTVKDPSTAVDAVIKRNDVAKKDVELERLKMVLEQNMLTPWVKENGFGGIDKARFEKALDQIGLTFTYKTKPKADDVFAEQFLPAGRSAQGELIVPLFLYLPLGGGCEDRERVGSEAPTSTDVALPPCVGSSRRSLKGRMQSRSALCPPSSTFRTSPTSMPGRGRRAAVRNLNSR